ncbi:hypothetical protein ACWELY_23870, partial [Streptomyces sp. NPDC004599]
VLCALVILSFYGGGFATNPAYLKDLFGTYQVRHHGGRTRHGPDEPAPAPAGPRFPVPAGRAGAAAHRPFLLVHAAPQVVGRPAGAVTLARSGR